MINVATFLNGYRVKVFILLGLFVAAVTV